MVFFAEFLVGPSPQWPGLHWCYVSLWPAIFASNRFRVYPDWVHSNSILRAGLIFTDCTLSEAWTRFMWLAEGRRKGKREKSDLPAERTEWETNRQTRRQWSEEQKRENSNDDRQSMRIGEQVRDRTIDVFGGEVEWSPSRLDGPFIVLSLCLSFHRSGQTANKRRNQTNRMRMGKSQSLFPFLGTSVNW